MTLPTPAKWAIGTLFATVALGGTWAFAHDEGGSAAQSTTDAYVQSDYSTVAPKVAGLIAQAAALVDADRAAIALSSANAKRYRALASDGSASLQEQQESAPRFDADEAARRRDTAAHAASRQEIEVLQAQLEGAAAAVARAQAALEAARLNLSYTRITAPVDGVVGRRSVRIGNYVQVGKPLLAVVPLDKAYVEANFRETQMRQIRPGQPATVKVDMLPGVTLKAHVESLAPASGVSFAEIAPENATGNFTKIVQRLSVRITIDPGQKDADRLRVGMSVTPTVDTKAAS